MSLVARVAKQICGSGLTGEQQDFAVGHAAPDGDRQVDAAQTGHDHVGEQQVGRNRLCNLESGFSVVGGHCRETCLLEYHGEGVGDDGFVVHDEDHRLSGIGLWEIRFGATSARGTV